MSTNDIDKAYISPYDQFLYKFDTVHEKSASQIKEIEKHKRIAHMRDDKNYCEEKKTIWESF